MHHPLQQRAVLTLDQLLQGLDPLTQPRQLVFHVPHLDFGLIDIRHRVVQDLALAELGGWAGVLLCGGGWWAVGAVVVVVEVEIGVWVVEATGPVLGVLEGGVEGGEFGV